MEKRVRTRLEGEPEGKARMEKLVRIRLEGEPEEMVRMGKRVRTLLEELPWEGEHGDMGKWVGAQLEVEREEVEKWVLTRLEGELRGMMVEEFQDEGEGMVWVSQLKQQHSISDPFHNFHLSH